MKLDAFQKQDRKNLKQDFESRGGELFSWHGNGVTIAVVPCAELYEESKFVKVAASYCNFEAGDKFNRKTGEYMVLCRWWQDDMAWTPRNDRSNAEIASSFYRFVVDR